jgi:hypothetical protein
VDVRNTRDKFEQNRDLTGVLPRFLISFAAAARMQSRKSVAGGYQRSCEPIVHDLPGRRISHSEDATLPALREQSDGSGERESLLILSFNEAIVPLGEIV